MKRLVALISSITLFFSLIGVTSAITTVDMPLADYTLQQMRTMAINALSMDYFMEADDGSWDGVIITHETPLFNLEGELIAYCFDLSCGEQESYIIVSATSDTHPIIQFAPHASSRYATMASTLSLQNASCVYLGPGQYYVTENQNQIMNLDTFEITSYTPIDSDVPATAAEIPSNNYYSVALMYLAGTTGESLMANGYEWHNLIDVPLYQWRKGCSPTAMAMVIDYTYAGVFSNSTETIDTLAEYMNTIIGGENDGYTDLAEIPLGTIDALVAAGEVYSNIGYPRTIFGYPATGATYNTYDAFQLEILNDRPVLITMNGASGTSDAYNTGFGDHSVTGVGYSCTPTSSSVIVHTTIVSDGDVYVTVSSATMGDYAWCFVVPWLGQ